MAELRPYVETQVDNTLVNLQNALTTVTIGVVAPSSNALDSSTVYQFTDADTALATVGSDSTKGNIASKLIRDIFSQTSKVLIKFVSLGTNADSATATTLNEPTGIAAGATTIAVDDASGLTVGDYITIGTGTTQEYRRVNAINTNDVDVYALDFDHVDAEDVTLITQYNPANIATARTALRDEEFRLYIEDTHNLETEIQTYMSDRDEDELLGQSFQGFESGVDPTAAKALVDNVVTDKYQIFVWARGKDKKDGIVYDRGACSAVKVLAKYALKLSETADDDSNILYSLNSLAIEEWSDVRRVDNGQQITINVADDLVNNNVSAIVSKRVAATAAIRIHKIVTTYASDGTFPATTYSNIADINGEIFLRDDLAFRIDNFLAEQIAARPPRPITTGSLERLRAFVQQTISDYPFFDLDPETEGFAPRLTITSPSAGKAQIDIIYKLQESIDQVCIRLIKSIR